MKKDDYDLETLKRWKYSSTKSKLEWLEHALKFFGNPKKSPEISCKKSKK